MKLNKLGLFSALAMCASFSANYAEAKLDKPNIVIFFADDISARELPLYGSSVWTAPDRSETSDLKYRANMPAIEKMANEGCWVTTMWAATVCNPSRAMMMSGRWAYQTKWWNNKDKGFGYDENGNLATWPVYMSSPILMGHAAQKSGYSTFWTGKTQMQGSWERHGFDEGCLTPGDIDLMENPYTTFRLENGKVDGKKAMVYVDNGEAVDAYPQQSWNFGPHAMLMNHPSTKEKFAWYPISKADKKEFGPHTFGADIELKYAFDFMERKVKEDKPFLVYHTTHLGHAAWDWLKPENGHCWSGTPKVTWDGKKYTRTDVKVTGSKGKYDTHGTVTENGQYNHLNYIDYQIWLYRNKFKELGIEDNTVFIFTADNGTAGYGKNSGDQQRGCHVPLVIYAPGMTKHGEQDVLVSMADIMPTVAELVGFDFPADYKVDGKSLVPFLFGDKKEHRDWVYTYRGPEQLIRGKDVLKDGRDKWWDVSGDPEDLTSFEEIKNWSSVSETKQAEFKELEKQLPKYDLYYTEYNQPGVNQQPKKRPRYSRKEK